MALEKVATGPWNFKKKLQSRFKKFKQKKDRPFIVPTGFGFIFGMVVLLLLMMALGSANNVLYIFVFFLVSVSVSAMVVTNDNLERVRILETSATEAFAEEETSFRVQLGNLSLRPSHLVVTKVGESQVQITEIPRQQERLVQLRGGSFKRGIQKIPKCQISSTFPFGMLRGWKIFRTQNTFLVYPARKGTLPFPQSSQNSQTQGEAGLFRDLREYQSTDSPRRIDWRASLKHDKMLIKNFETLTEKSFSFHWDHTSNLIDFETRLSQLTTWVDQAEKSGNLYSMEIGHFKTEVNRGFSHCHKCLEHLALLNPNLVATHLKTGPDL